MELLNRGTLDQLANDIGSDMLPVVIGVFVDEVGRQRGQLRALLDADERVALGRLAHSLKSSCASYGAELSQAQAARLEQACHGDRPASELAALVDELAESLAQVLALLNAPPS